MKKDKAASTVLISGLRWTRERRRGTLGDRHHQRSNRQSSIQLFKRALQLVSLSVLRFLKFTDSARTTWRLAWELRKNICCCNFPSQRNLFQDLQARPLPCNWEDVQAVWKKKKKNRKHWLCAQAAWAGSSSWRWGGPPAGRSTHQTVQFSRHLHLPI